MKRSNQFILMLSVVLGVVACGSDGDGAAKPAKSKLDANKQVGKLEKEEKVVFAKEINSYTTQNIETVCTFVGAHSYAVDKTGTSCESEIDDCIKSSTKSDEEDFVNGMKDCGMTVGEINTCMGDLIGSFVKLAKGVSCTTSAETLEKSYNSYAVPQSCEKLQAESCLGVFDNPTDKDDSADGAQNEGDVEESRQIDPLGDEEKAALENGSLDQE